MKRGAHVKVLIEAFSVWFAWWASWVTLCILWVLCWLTVVLGPPATFALVYAANYGTLGVMPTKRELAGVALKQFWMSWLWMLTNVLAAAVVWANTLFYASLPPVGWQIGRWVIAVLLAVWWVTQFYSLPYYFIQERKSLWVAYRNGFLTALSAPFYTLVVAGAGLLVAAVSLILVAPLAIGGPALVALIANAAVFERLKTYKLIEE